jgi:hypothetical protein
LPQKQRNWVRQHEVDAGQREGVSTAEGQCMSYARPTRT